MKNVTLILFLVLVAGVSRLVPHPWNFTAVGAMALFAGARMPHKGLAFLAPFLSLLWTDAVLGFHSTIVFVYAAVALVTILGFYARDHFRKVVAGSLLASALFFVITNFGVWMMQDLYAKSFEGLVQCFVMAVPFFGNQVAGDLVYTAALFGAYEGLKIFAPSLASSGKSANSSSSL
jgi:hypothetical protein